MRLSFSTGSLYGFRLTNVLGLMAATGFEGVELLIAPEVLWRGPDRVKEMVKANGLDINVIHRGLVPLPGWRENGAGMVRMVDFARAVEAPTVVIHPPRKCSALDDAVAVDFARRVDAAVSEAGEDVTIAIENLSLKRPADEQNPFCDLRVLRTFAADHGLAMTLDTSHAASFGFDILDCYRHFRGRILNLHLSDYRPRAKLLDRLATNHFAQHQKPGTGVLPLEELVGGMSAEGYTGNISLEVGPLPTRAWWRPALRRHMRDMADFVKGCRAAGRQPGARGVRATPGP
jgi:sugar phosphate isomerase/epimerase